MTADQLRKAKNKDLPASLIAIQRAEQSVRELAVRPVRITADELRKAIP